ncbi:MAG: hypothetical protein AAFP90_16790 [Planctomycetota bacterium]
MREGYSHEDDYCQIELLPDVNWDFCANQMTEIDTFSDRHRTDAGWTDIYVRSENPTPLTDLSINRDIFVQSLDNLLPSFDRVKTGYSTYTEACANTLALGRDDNVVIFAEHDENDAVSKIWLTLDVYTADDRAVAHKALQIISQWPLILVDWGWSVLIRLADAEALADYFDKRVIAFEDFNRRMNWNDKA